MIAYSKARRVCTTSNALTRPCYCHLCQLRVVSRSLSSSSASTLVHAFIANRYCSSLYCGLPQVRLRPLNGVLRAAARMIGGVLRFGHITDYMRDVLHWLPVQQPSTIGLGVIILEICFCHKF